MAAVLDDLKQRLPEREEGDGAGHQQGETAGKDQHEVQQAHVYPLPLTKPEERLQAARQRMTLEERLQVTMPKSATMCRRCRAPQSSTPQQSWVLTEVDSPQASCEAAQTPPLRKGCEQVSAEIQGLQGQAAPEPWEPGQGIS